MGALIRWWVINDSRKQGHYNIFTKFREEWVNKLSHESEIASNDETRIGQANIE